MSDAEKAAWRAGWKHGAVAAELSAEAVRARGLECAREPGLISNIRREFLAQARGAEDCAQAIRALPLPEPPDA